MASSQKIWKDLEMGINLYIPNFSQIKQALDELEQEEYTFEDLMSEPDLDLDITYKKESLYSGKLNEGIFSLSVPPKPVVSTLFNRELKEDKELFRDAWENEKYVFLYYGD